MPAILSLLRLEPGVAQALTLADGPDDGTLATTVSSGGLDAVLHNGILQLLLTRAVIADADFEGLFTALRRLFLRGYEASDGAAPHWSKRYLDFAAALACQCDLTGYAYAESEAEKEILNRIEADSAIATGDAEELLPNMLLQAMYRPLTDTDRAAALPAPDKTCVARAPSSVATLAG